MKLHYLRGDIAAAIAAYEHCRQTLKREFNAAPSAETEAMRATLTAGTTAKTAVALRRVPTAVLRPPRLVGRDAEWATLQAAWDAGEAAFVLGEAGLGKTRLLTDFARAAGGTLVVSARPGDERVVYAVTTRLLRQLPRDALANLDAGLRKELARLLPELGEAEPIRSEAERTRFFNAVAVALAAESGLVGVAVDDLHFADAASIELLQYLSAERSLRWLFAGRTAEVGAAAQGLLDAVRARAPADVIELAPMTLAQLTELLTSLDLEGMNAAAMAPALLRHTGGNPLFVLETIKTWLNQGGEGDAQRLPAVAQVGTLIERRIGRLSADAVKLARCAAVAGQDFSAELAAKVLGVRPLDLVDAWAELEAAQVFRDGAFAHDLIYESALASVPPPIARQLHCEIAQFLAARDGEPVRIARHWQAGDQAASAVPWLLRAAAIAEARGALSEEIELREQAARIDDAAGNSQREFDNRNALVSRYERTTRLDDSARNIDRIAELARTPLEQGWVLSARANLANKRGDIAGSVEPGRQAFELARAHDSAELACDATNVLVPALNFLGRFDEALTTVESARPYYERAGDDWRTQFLSIRATTLNNLQRRQEARSDLDAALTLARQQHNTAAQISLLTNAAISFRSSGLLAESIAAAEEAERIQQQVDANPRTGINVQLVLGVNLRDRGAYGQALTRLDRVLELADERTPMFRQPALNTLALLWLQLGQPARAQPLQKEALRYGQVAIWLVARAHLQLGLLRQRLGQPARDCFEQALRVAPPTGRPLTYMHASLCLAELDGGDAGYSRAIEIDRQALAGEFTGMRVVAQAALTRIALADRAPQRAALHAREAIWLLAQADPDETYRGDIWLAAYRALVAVGDPHADDVMNSAVTWITQVAQQAVPTEFRDGFLNRNPVNRDLLTMATRLR
jgi:tetratricopeptide (TPR) repeat protein